MFVRCQQDIEAGRLCRVNQFAVSQPIPAAFNCFDNLVTLGALLELPREGLLLMQKIGAETLCKPVRFEFPGFNSISQFALPN